jgi:hypothetical protein
MTLDEQLSALAAGDLPEAEAAVLRQRIADEPEVAARWRAMQGLIADLASLPATASPPVLRRRRPTGRIATGLLAAAAVLFALWPAPPAEVLLASGETWVDGDLSLLAGDRRITVDGRARILVEPPPGVVRGGVQEDPMDTRTLAAGLAGAILTITVYEGLAVVSAGDTTTTVHAGDTHTTRAARPSAPVAAPGTPERAQDLADRVAALQEELDATKDALAAERFSGALTRGQLTAERGLVSEWPSEVPAAARPDAIAASVEDALGDLPEASVTRVDCDEYPCLVAIRYTGPEQQKRVWQGDIAERIEQWTEATFGEDASIGQNTSVYRNGDHEGRFVMFGGYAGGSEEVKARLGWRMERLVEGVAAEMQQEARQAAEGAVEP